DRLGATFLVNRLKVVLLDLPLSSVAVMVTVCDSPRPSTGVYLHVQAPLPFFATVPTEAASVTGSGPGSLKVPVLEAVWQEKTCLWKNETSLVASGTEGGQCGDVVGQVHGVLGLAPAWAAAPGRTTNRESP